MKFDVYGRFQLEVAREDNTWVVYRVVPGKRIRAEEVTIPSEMQPSEIAHVVRAITAMPVQIGSSTIPMWVSWVGAVVAATLCVWAFRSR